jgi:hypothetical protein
LTWAQAEAEAKVRSNVASASFIAIFLLASLLLEDKVQYTGRWVTG